MGILLSLPQGKAELAGLRIQDTPAQQKGSMQMRTITKMRIGLAVLLLAASCASTTMADPTDFDYHANFKVFDVGVMANNSPATGLFVSQDYVPSMDAMRYGVTRESEGGWSEVFAPAYTGIYPLSDAVALARSSEDVLRILDLETGTERALPAPAGEASIGRNWGRLTSLWSRSRVDGQQQIRKRIWVTSALNSQGVAYSMLLDSDGSILRSLTDLKPTGKWRNPVLTDTGSYLFANSSDANGQPTCSTYTHDGNLLAEDMAPIESFPLGATEAHGNFDVELVQTEYLVAMGELPNRPPGELDYQGHGLFLQEVGQRADDRLRYWDPRVYHPLDERGVPVPLPTHVVGLMRIVTHVPDGREGRWRHAVDEAPGGYHSGWVVLFGTPEGKREFGFAKGSALHALQVAGTLARYSAWEQGGLHEYDFEGVWRPARAFARRASDSLWETIDLETMGPYAQEPYGKAEAWGSLLTDRDLPALKKYNFDFVDELSKGMAVARTNQEREAAEAARAKELERAETFRRERLAACREAISKGESYTARTLLTTWDLGPGEDQAWASYYTQFGCRSSYELAHARDLGVDAGALAQLSADLALREQQLRADQQAAADTAAARAAWQQALTRPILIEKVEIEYLGSGLTRVRKTQVPLFR